MEDDGRAHGGQRNLRVALHVEESYLTVIHKLKVEAWEVRTDVALGILRDSWVLAEPNESARSVQRKKHQRHKANCSDQTHPIKVDTDGLFVALAVRLRDERVQRLVHAPT